MAYSDSKLDVILPLIVTRLISQMSQSAATCFLGDPEEEYPNPGHVYYVVYFDGGRFDDSLWGGGGREQLACDAIVGVKIVTRNQLDEPGRDNQKLNHATLGLFPRLHAVLDALAGFEIVSGSDPQVREVLQPLDIPTRIKRAKGSASLTVRFGCLFDWNLT